MYLTTSAHAKPLLSASVHGNDTESLPAAEGRPVPRRADLHLGSSLELSRCAGLPTAAEVATMAGTTATAAEEPVCQCLYGH